MGSQSITGRDVSSGQPIVLTVENGCIQSIAPGPPDESAWLTPGFIDLQVNGYLGSDLNADTIDPDVVVALTYKMISVGVTTFLPTIITASEQRIIAGLRAVAEARRSDPVVAHAIPYVHVEGPYISPVDGPRGAHPREQVRSASLDEFGRWQAASDDLVGMVTLSPHEDAAFPYIAALSRRGICMAIGHSDATPAQIRAATDAGATLSTHLGNGLGSPIARHPNLLWAQLAEDRLTAALIADGHHLPADTLKAMLRAKGIERSLLVSDVVALGGMAPGTYQSPVGGTVEVTQDGCIRSATGGGFLAGAYSSLRDCVAHVAGMADFTLKDAVRMATENPGRFVGGRGQLRVGADADLVRFAWEGPTAKLRIQSVLVRGKECRAS